MSQYLPTGDFREIKVTRSNLKTFLRTPDNDDHGFLIECDLEYPSSIHEKTKNFPYLPEKKNSLNRRFFSLYDGKKTEKINLQKNCLWIRQINRDIFYNIEI